jgi:hypothetical protein
MEIKIKPGSIFRSVQITDERTTIDLGLLGEEETRELIGVLRTALEELGDPLR